MHKQIETQSDIDNGGAAVIAWMMFAVVVAVVGVIIWMCK